MIDVKVALSTNANKEAGVEPFFQSLAFDYSNGDSRLKVDADVLFGERRSPESTYGESGAIELRFAGSDSKSLALKAADEVKVNYSRAGLTKPAFIEIGHVAGTNACLKFYK